MELKYEYKILEWDEARKGPRWQLEATLKALGSAGWKVYNIQNKAQYGADVHTIWLMKENGQC